MSQHTIVATIEQGEVLKVSDLSEEPRVERGLVLLKLNCKSAAQRAEVMQIADIYRARVVDVATNLLMIEVTGPTPKLDSFIDLLHTYGIRELVRTGVIAMARGHGATAVEPHHHLRLVG
jgi:acetolactate synthase I/III small subunit